MSTLLLLDGNSLTYRAFFALPTDLATASGQVTNAVFGFTSMLVNLVRDHRPDQLVVAFDRPEPTFRHELVPTYKGQRDETPDLLVPQFDLVRQVLDVLGIPTVERPGFEADDLIATYATRARDAGDDVIVVTGDRDSYQLVEDPHVRVLYNRRGVSDYVLYDEAGILERTGVAPALYPDYAALRGDPSDNLPGVPGVGEKTAAKLISRYGGLEGVLAHIDEQTPKLRENLSAHQDQVRLNLEAMVLVRDVPDLPEPPGLDWSNLAVEEVQRLFDFLEFRTLYERLHEALGEQLPGGQGLTEIDPQVTTLDLAAARELLEGAEVGQLVAVASGEPAGGDTSGLALVTDVASGSVAWIPVEVLDDPALADPLARWAARVGLVGHRIKPLVRMLLRRGVGEVDVAADSALAAYLLDPAEGRYQLDELLARHTGAALAEGSSVPAGQLDLDGSGQEEATAVCGRALAAALLVEPLSQAVGEEALGRLLHEVELPLVVTLARMEEVGIGVDRAELERLNAHLMAEVDRLRSEIWSHAGHEFNVNSTPQLRTVLFDELGLTPSKKTKTGYSTDAASLEKLRGEHDIVDALLDYREVEKLRSTYGEGLLGWVADDGRIHAHFNQMVARTGRLSSEDPNLHNIPVRSEQGREFRRAFVPAPGHELLVADYNQIELRVIAHLAEDPGLIGAFESGQDIHAATAARIFGVDADQVSVDQRSTAKMVSYGLAYGMEAYGLAQRLGIPTDEAALVLEAYFAAFPNVREFMDRVVAEARERGFSETAMGRRRPIPELHARNYRVRQAAERQAMNAPIQGLAADLFKIALVRLDAALIASGVRSRLVLQVHDEVILEVPPEEADEITALTVEVMARAGELRVPLEVNVARGSSWAAAKG